jgi:hypothetical protein
VDDQRMLSKETEIGRAEVIKLKVGRGVEEKKGL